MMNHKPTGKKLPHLVKRLKVCRLHWPQPNAEFAGRIGPSHSRRPPQSMSARPAHIMMLMACRLPTRPHAHASSGGGDRGRGRMMHSSSSCSLATSTTSRRHGTKTSVTGMIQIARSRISIAAGFFAVPSWAADLWPLQGKDGGPLACFASLRGQVCCSALLAAGELLAC